MLLDTVTPGWFEPINPNTLVVSNREACVFAQASHDFKKGITSVAEKALAMNLPGVRTLSNRDEEGKKDWWNGKMRRLYSWLPEGSRIIDVFYYGFDIAWGDTEALVPDQWGEGSRRETFKVIDRMWKRVVVQKKKAHRAE